MCPVFTLCVSHWAVRQTKVPLVYLLWTLQSSCKCLFCCCSAVCNWLSQFLFLSLAEFLYATFLIASISNLGCLVRAKHKVTLSCQWKTVKQCLWKENFFIHYRKEWHENNSVYSEAFRESRQQFRKRVSSWLLWVSQNGFNSSKLIAQPYGYQSFYS